jgi:hypothetical protein
MGYPCGGLLGFGRMLTLIAGCEPRDVGPLESLNPGAGDIIECEAPAPTRRGLLLSRGGSCRTTPFLVPRRKRLAPRGDLGC